MKILVDQMNELNKKDKVEDNLFVKNIIVNKDKDKKYLNKKEKIIFVAKGNKEEKYKKFESEEDLSLQEEYESF